MDSSTLEESTTKSASVARISNVSICCGDEDLEGINERPTEFGISPDALSRASLVTLRAGDPGVLGDEISSSLPTGVQTLCVTIDRLGESGRVGDDIK